MKQAVACIGLTGCVLIIQTGGRISLRGGRQSLIRLRSARFSRRLHRTAVLQDDPVLCGISRQLKIAARAVIRVRCAVIFRVLGLI